MLNVRDLHQYYGGSHILRGVCHEARPGEVTALLGRNGVGKTTTLRAMLGLVPRSRGTISLAGAEITKLPTHTIVQRGVGYVGRGKAEFPVKDKAAVERLTRELHEDAKTKGSKRIYEWGTGGGFSGAALGGWLPIKNYSTGVFPEHEKLDGQYIRTHFKMKDNPCWACQLRHCKLCEVTEGPYKGFKGEEPECEGLAAWGSVIGNADAGAAVMLNWFNDNMGLDLNEAGWVVGWVMECYEKGVFTQKDLGGRDLKWGNPEAAVSKCRAERSARRSG